MKYLVLTALAALPSVATAHETALPHVHPHGSDLLLTALLVVPALAFFLWLAVRRH